jgi:murein DD-endopeptidase MepM/ murein hydrolase activator NlpD
MHTSKTSIKFPKTVRELRERVAALSELRERVTAFPARLRGRRPVAMAALGVMTAGVLAGTAALTDGGPSDPTGTAAATTASVTDPEAAKRAELVQRANRAARAEAAKKAAQPAKPKATAKPKAAAKRAPAKKWVAPMNGAPLSSCFGPRWGTMHKGLDFAGDAGTAIRAVGAGRVVAAGWNYTGYGISVVIDHGNGYLTHYAHASKVTVKPGQKVKPGQRIALEGSTGDSTGPHLHFEVHKGMWNQINPAKWLRAHGVHLGC